MVGFAQVFVRLGSGLMSFCFLIWFDLVSLGLIRFSFWVSLLWFYLIGIALTRSWFDWDGFWIGCIWLRFDWWKSGLIETGMGLIKCFLEHIQIRLVSGLLGSKYEYGRNIVHLNPHQYCFRISLCTIECNVDHMFKFALSLAEFPECLRHRALDLAFDVCIYGLLELTYKPELWRWVVDNICSLQLWRFWFGVLADLPNGFEFDPAILKSRPR